MSETLVVAIVFLALPALEWWRWGRRGWRRLRVGTLVLAIGVLWFYQPVLYSALRGTLSMPSTARDTTFFGGRRLSEYESGAVTMFHVASDAAKRMAPTHNVALGVLIWLAISPVFRRTVRGVGLKPASEIDPAIVLDDHRERAV